MISSIITQKPFININARELASVYNEIARQNKTFALGLMAEGYRADIAAEDIMHATEKLNVFNDAGKLTKNGKQKIKFTLKSLFHIDTKQAEKFTVGEYITKIVKGLEDFNLRAKNI